MLTLEENVQERAIKRNILCVELNKIVIFPKKVFELLNLQFSQYYLQKAIDDNTEYGGFHWKYVYNDKNKEKIKLKFYCKELGKIIDHPYKFYKILGIRFSKKDFLNSIRSNKSYNGYNWVAKIDGE